MTSKEKAPAPARTFFDPFNSSSTGHQRAENRLAGSTGWRQSRSIKLAHQFGDVTGRGGLTHVSDTIGAGSEQFGKDGRKENGGWKIGARGSSEEGCQDIRTVVNKRKRPETSNDEVEGCCKKMRTVVKDRVDMPNVGGTPDVIQTGRSSGPSASYKDGIESHQLCQTTAPPKQIFRSLSLYLNGSTLSSEISDHKLKSLFVQGGGSISLSLARRAVTHVVLSSNANTLAASKMQREITKKGGKSVKYVTAAWVVDSVKAGKRLPEYRYSGAHTALEGQKSALDALADKKICSKSRA